MQDRVVFTIRNVNDLQRFNELSKDITRLTLVSDNNKFEVDLGILNHLPNIEELALAGNFTGLEKVAMLKNLHSLSLQLKLKENDDLECMMTNTLTYLEVRDMRKLSDLSFIEKAPNLRKLFLMSLPSVYRLPRLNNIYALKIYELHKLVELDELKESKIRYLGLDLCSDTLSGTALAKIISCMSSIEHVDTHLDRNYKRDNVVCNQLIKMKLENLISNTGIMSMDNFLKL